MMDATLRIKNLSIALEALSRLHLDVYYSEVEVLLACAIQEAKKENQWPQRPVKPEPQFNPFTNSDEEIPF